MELGEEEDTLLVQVSGTGGMLEVTSSSLQKSCLSISDDSAI